MSEKTDQHNPSSYAEVILLSSDSAENEFDSQTKPEPKRLLSGMFSSVSDAELLTQTLSAEAVDSQDNPEQ
jgi:hypothetical protein